MITKKEQEMIEQVLNEFDFMNIHKYMFSTNWKWCGSETPPTIYELIKVAMRLLEEGCECETTTVVSAGGFRVEVIKNNAGETESLELMFVLESTYVSTIRGLHDSNY